MTGRIEVVEADLRHLDDRPGDVLILTVFADERPLEGLSGLVDWRLRGALSRWLQSGFATGGLGEHLLYPSSGRLTHRLVLLVGLGRRAEHRTDRARDAAARAATAVAGLGASHVTCGLFGLDQLPTPLGRSLPGLLEALRAEPAIDAITLAAPRKLLDTVKACS